VFECAVGDHNSRQGRRLTLNRRDTPLGARSLLSRNGSDPTQRLATAAAVLEQVMFLRSQSEAYLGGARMAHRLTSESERSEHVRPVPQLVCLGMPRQHLLTIQRDANDAPASGFVVWGALHMQQDRRYGR
jgi:hypothetical protein